jgi:hypothetical protein
MTPEIEELIKDFLFSVEKYKAQAWKSEQDYLEALNDRANKLLTKSLK